MTDNKALSLFERIGGAETVNALVSAYFWELHTQPRAPTLCGFYSKATDHYQTRMVEYITGFLGGPGLYQQAHGLPMLREQHCRLTIDDAMRDQWYGCMQAAIADVISDAALRTQLEAAFWRMADSLRNA